MTEENNILTLTQGVTKFFMDSQIVALNSFPEEEGRVNVCIYILKDLKNSLYMLLVNFADRWSWSNYNPIDVIVEDYEKLLFNERMARKIIERVH
jgi:hypothetical protein